MPRLVSITTILAVSAVFLTSISSASAAHKVNFGYLYNKVNNTYISIQSLADAHNAYVKHHHSRCSDGQKKKWIANARKNLNTVAAVNETLTGVIGKARKKKIYHDLVQTARDLKHWGTRQVIPRLPRCKAMADRTYAVEQDLINDQCDLGLCHY